jgi:hypothetical protein
VNRFRVPSEVAWHASEDHVAVLDLSDARGIPSVLDGPAFEVWTAVVEVGYEGAERVIEHVAGRYGLPAAEIEADVTSFLQELVGLGLVTTSAEPF